MTLGEKITELRNKKGLTQEQLANLLNVTRQAISKYENNQSEPDLATIRRLCTIFDVRYEELLGELDISNKTEVREINKEELKQTPFTSLLVSIFLFVFSACFLGFLALNIGSIFIYFDGGIVSSNFNFYNILSGQIYGLTTLANACFAFLIISFIFTLVLIIYCIVDFIFELLNKNDSKYSKISKITYTSIISIHFLSFVIGFILATRISDLSINSGFYVLLVLELIMFISYSTYFICKVTYIKSNNYFRLFTNYKRYEFFCLFLVNLIIYLSLQLFSSEVGLIQISDTIGVVFKFMAINIHTLNYTQSNIIGAYVVLMWIASISMLINILFNLVCFLLPNLKIKLLNIINVSLQVFSIICIAVGCYYLNLASVRPYCYVHLYTSVFSYAFNNIFYFVLFDTIIYLVYGLIYRHSKKKSKVEEVSIN